jgi:hypothetical protein
VAVAAAAMAAVVAAARAAVAAVRAAASTDLLARQCKAAALEYWGRRLSGRAGSPEQGDGGFQGAVAVLVVKARI